MRFVIGIISVLFCLFISGCVSKPKVVTLADLPVYQDTKKQYNTSAGCYFECRSNLVSQPAQINYSPYSGASLLFVPPNNQYLAQKIAEMQKAAAAKTSTALKNAFVGALKENDYKVIEISNINTKRIRQQAEKVIFLVNYQTRSIYMPQVKKRATDAYIVVTVLDVPANFKQKKSPPRYFSAWGRDISAQKINDIKAAGKAVNKARVNAIDNLFRVDAFRKALEPKK